MPDSVTPYWKPVAPPPQKKVGAELGHCNRVPVPTHIGDSI